MFKKPLNNLKTSAPLRSSDRRKLKQRVVNSFSISAENADVLVPDGILSVKFKTHLDEPGIAYLSPGGDPVWFTIGKGSEDLIPTIYTLWKNAKLLPFVSTPKAVIPILVGGADLMIPGIVHCSPSLKEGQLVAVCKYERTNDIPTLSPPLAVGTMAVSSDQLHDGGKEKGKGVLVLHTWKDHLWEMGSKSEPPEDTALTVGNDPEAEETDGDPQNNIDSAEVTEAVASLSISKDFTSASAPPQSALTYTADEITSILNKALIHAISTTLASLPTSSFPIPATIFYTSHILPNRPNFPALVLEPASGPPTSDSKEYNGPSPQDITIKSSSHKSLTTFLKAAEKAGLLTAKTPQKHSAQSDLLITSVNGSHPEIQGHKPFVTIRDVEQKAAKKAMREDQEKERQAAASGEIEVKELWKPHLSSVALFQTMGGSSSDLYTLPEIRALLNSYIASQDLVNKHEPAFINLDAALVSCISSKQGGSKSKDKDKTPTRGAEETEFMRRDELSKKVVEKMQRWYQIRAEGKDTVTKKGQLSPIQVAMKMRQGRKASTLITGFEPFYIDAEEMAEELRKTCAGATSISPITGKPANSGMEVLVQGKQSKAVVDYLIGKGVPKKWIEAIDAIGKK
ncbi:hypothetical protein K435DRAFT_958852 [Dendrothele bispora CBS 962.96]|uniref:SUI1 domain-containing protein n=1 Tax=Dendrothele bispora (strain CBS 962.96) TaxID=1314807 RepID=A0A4S8MYQ2_DENBC|nr:hypothetical protein K435DRAFT_958852 [Dendrothele bispora CBS 962.96]